MKKEDIEMKTGLIEDGLPGLEPLLQKAKDHARELEQQADGLQQYGHF